MVDMSANNKKINVHAYQKSDYATIYEFILINSKLTHVPYFFMDPL